MWLFSKNTKNSTSEEELNVSEEVLWWLDEFSKKILESAKLSDKQLKEVLKNAESVSNFVNKTINEANKKIFDNTEILELLLSYKPDIFQTNLKIKTLINNKLKKDFNKNQNLAFFVIRNLINDDSPKEHIDFFIKNIAWDNEIIKEKLENIFKELLENKAISTAWNLRKLFYTISDENLINQILQSKIISKNWVINKDLIKILEKEINQNLEKEELEEKQNIFNFLVEKLAISKEFLKNNSLINFINSLVDLIKVNKKVEENSKNENLNNSDNKKEDLNNPSQSSLEKGRASNNFEQDSWLLNFCYPWCILNELWNNYEIDLWQNQKVKISKQDYNKFNEKSLQNYINFLKILKQAKLEFLFENKYKSWFLTLLNKKFGWFDYKTWEWFKEFYTLKTLTLIWNLIWVPKKYLSSKWELWEFDWIISALNIFSQINETWNINQEKIATPWNLIWPWVIEKRMLQLWILWENWGFSLIKAEEILKKWKLSD